MGNPTTEVTDKYRVQGEILRDKYEQNHFDALTSQLQASLARERALLSEKLDLSQRQSMLTREFEHRLTNGLQLVVSLLALQSRAATTAEAADQLTIAARRVSALGGVHHRLHLLDHQDNVEFKEYLLRLCDDLSSLLFDVQTSNTIIVEGVEVIIPTASAIPLGFIVNELITNSVKHAKGHIIVRIEAKSATSYSMSVLDEGPGLPPEFNVETSTGLGMKIIQSLVMQIGGAFQIYSGDNGRGTCSTVTFWCPDCRTGGP